MRLMWKLHFIIFKKILSFMRCEKKKRKIRLMLISNSKCFNFNSFNFFFFMFFLSVVFICFVSILSVFIFFSTLSIFVFFSAIFRFSTAIFFFSVRFLVNCFVRFSKFRCFVFQKNQHVIFQQFDEKWKFEKIYCLTCAASIEYAQTAETNSASFDKKRLWFSNNSKFEKRKKSNCLTKNAYFVWHRNSIN